MRALLRCALHGLAALWVLCWAVVPAHAQIHPITRITLTDAQQAEGTSVLLPHFLKQPQSGLVTFDWRVSLPVALHSARLPALLLPQPVQGATFWIGDELIYEIASSDENNLRNWYRPVLVSIPRHLLSANDDTVIRVRQAGYLRGWFVSPMMAGEIAALRPWFDGFTLLSQTLSVTTNILAGGIGLFLLGIGWRSKGAAYLYSGWATVTWSLLFTLALISEVPTHQWFYWRLTLYLCTGLVIYFISMFTFEIFRQRLHQFLRLGFLAYANLGWVIFALGGEKTEYFLDTYWTVSVAGMYTACTVWMIVKTLRRRQGRTLIPFFVHATGSSLFAFHDYILQAGWLPFTLSEETQPLWTYALLQPIYLTHLALPSFVIMALWMLAKDHLQKTQEALQHERQLQQQREQMVLDIHDGVGSRINMLLWDFRLSKSLPDQIELELQRCMDELRFAINPTEAGHETLHKALDDLCKRMQNSAQQVKITYSRSGASSAVRSDLGIQLYKAVQECLSNALRHSQARQIDIALVQQPEMVEVSVSDDGVGIADWDEATQSQTSRKLTSLGLRGLQQRMRGKGGDAYIQSGAQGTRVRCWLPLS